MGVVVKWSISTPEFKAEAVRQDFERGHSVAEIAACLGVSTHSLYRWVILTCSEVFDQSLIKVVQPEDVPNPIWLTSASASPNQQRFADALLAEYPFVLIPSTVTRHSWNLLVSCELAEGRYRMISQERFGLDTRLVKV